MKAAIAEIKVSNCWQVAAGSVGRDYTKAFLESGIAFVGGDIYGTTMARVEPGDTMILKRGRSEIIAVGRVVSRAGVHRGDARGDDSRFWLRDFDGWDLYAWCYVDWRQPVDGPCRATGLTRTTMQQVWQQSLLEIVEGALENWPRREEWAPEPQPTRSVADEQIVDFLIKQGLRIHDAEDLSAAIIESAD